MKLRNFLFAIGLVVPTIAGTVVPAAADTDARTPTTVPAAKAADPLRDALSSLRVPDSLRASVMNAIGNATGSFTIYRADGVRPRMVADIHGPVTVVMDLDFRSPIAGKLRIEKVGEKLTLSAEAGQLTTIYTKKSFGTSLEESSVPVELKSEPNAALRFVTLRKTTHEVTFASEHELAIAQSQGALNRLKSHEKRAIAGGGHVFTKITFHIDGREISRDDLRVFLDKRAARAPQI